MNCCGAVLPFLTPEMPVKIAFRRTVWHECFMSELEKQIHEIDLICADLHDRLIAIDALERGMGASLAGLLIQIFDQVVQKPDEQNAVARLNQTRLTV